MLQSRQRVARLEETVTTEPPQYKLPHHGAFLVGAGIGAAALAICLFVLPVYAVAIGANAMFASYLGITAWEFRCFTPAFLRKRAADADTPVVAIFGVTATVVVVSVLFLFLAVNEEGRLDAVAVSASAVSVLLGWFTIHTMAALHYAYEYYEVPAASRKKGAIVGGLEFPDNSEPDGAAFLYFSYVVAMTAQVSDVAVVSNPMRKLVTIHGVFSFFFNTVILAATVNVAVTLAGK
jgi:uncharacterized membrane protein